MKRPNKFMVAFLLVLLLVVLMQTGSQAPVNWSPSFSAADKIPYGSYILREVVPELFSGRNVTDAKLPAYNVLSEADTAVYMVINSSFDPDKLDIEKLLDFVHHGNTAFIAAARIDPTFADTLGLSLGYNYSPFGDSTSLNFCSAAQRSARNYRYKRNTVDEYFTAFDTARTVVLGVNADSQATYVKVPYGHGSFYVSSVPYAFTNYNMVNPVNADYAFKALSYLPKNDVIWDEAYKDGRQMVDSPLRYILEQDALRWGMYVLLATAVLFVVFMGRRRQRVIPVVKPLPNTTLEFVQTVGQLYFQHGDHANLAEKKISYFLEHVRTTYGVHMNGPAEDLYRTVAARSGVPEDRVREVFVAIDHVRAAERLSDSDLLKLSRVIEEFHAARLR